MTTSTLYYLFSTVAQVMAAVSALLAIFTQFKLASIKVFLLGDGKATFARMGNKETGYDLEADYKKYYDRLRDSLERESISGIQEVIEKLARNEQDKNKTLETNPRGLQYLEAAFKDRISQMKKIKVRTKMSIVFSFISIFSSIISIVFVERIIHHCDSIWKIIIFIFIMISISTAYTISGIFSGLKDLEDV